MAKALYRKYRPCSLSEVIGQEQVTAPLESMLKSGSFSHAYLFCGPRGCGKTSVARIFAHAVNDFKYELEDEYLDIVEIDAASNTGVDNIRELREKATIVPSVGKYKVYIIDEVHMLSKSAFNALLKTLEEPPEHVIFVMATTDPDKIPATILSRTQAYYFKLVDPAIMLAHLESIAKKEKIKITEDALKIIVRRGGGSFRDSLSLLDQISTLSGKEITADAVNSVLGLPSEQIVDGLLAAYKDGSLAAASDLLNSFYNIGGKAEALASDLIARILSAPDPAYYGLLKQLPEVHDPFADAKLLLCFMQEEAPVSVTARVTREGGPTKCFAPAKILGEERGRTRASDGRPEEEPSRQAPPAQAPFDYNAFLARLSSPRLLSLLKSSTHTFDGSTLTIFPGNGLARKTFIKPESQKILRDALGNFTLVISEDAAANPAPAQKDPTISQISDIMGSVQEVNDGGGVPF